MLDVAVLTEEQVECLASVTRAEVFESFCRLGEASVEEVATDLKRVQTSLYYHVEQLVSAGLIVPAGSRLSVTKTESLYKPLAPRLRLDKRNRTPAHRAALKSAVRNALNAAEREHSAAQDALNEVDTTQLLRISSRLDEKDANELRQRLAELGEWVRSRDKAGMPRYSLTGVLTPLKR